MAETVLLSGTLMVVVLLIAAIVCGLVLWLVRHAIQRPLTRLAEDMLRVADGDTSIGAGGGSSRIAEVVALGEALETFRTHVDALSQYTSALQQFQQLSTDRSEEHTSELQSLMRISYAVFCLKKITNKTKHEKQHHI